MFRTERKVAMAERFQRLFTLSPNQYAKGCPVIIEAGALQKDTVSNSVLAQIKMKNIGAKTVKSCKVSIRAYENNGSEVEGVSDFSFLDLNVEPGESFGSKVPIYMPEHITRSITVFVSEIVFEDGLVQKTEEDEWKPVPDFRSISEEFGSEDLIEQLSIEMGYQAKYVPEIKEGLFMCACGEINLDNVSACNCCGNSFDSLCSMLDKDSLEKHYLTRKKEEEAELQRKKEKEEVELQQKKEKEEKTKKTAKMIFALAAVVIIVIAAFSYIKYKNTLEHYSPKAKDFGNYSLLESNIPFDAVIKSVSAGDTAKQFFEATGFTHGTESLAPKGISFPVDNVQLFGIDMIAKVNTERDFKNDNDDNRVRHFFFGNGDISDKDADFDTINVSA